MLPARKTRTGSTEVFSVDAPPGTDHSRPMVHYADKNRVGRAVRSRPKPIEQFEVDVLPALSTANVRALLRAVMPLPQLTYAEAEAQVTKHLVNRTRSRKSRMKGRHKGP